MSVEATIRNMVRGEIEEAIAPLAQAVANLQEQKRVLAQLSAVLTANISSSVISSARAGVRLRRRSR